MSFKTSLLTTTLDLPLWSVAGWVRCSRLIMHAGVGEIKSRKILHSADPAYLYRIGHVMQGRSRDYRFIRSISRTYDRVKAYMQDRLRDYRFIRSISRTWRHGNEFQPHFGLLIKLTKTKVANLQTIKNYFKVLLLIALARLYTTGIRAKPDPR